MSKSGIPPVTIGTIGENRVFEYLTVLSRAFLVIYGPKSDIEGTDILVKRRHLAGVLCLQIKTRVAQRKGGALELGIEASELPAADPKYVVVIHYDQEKAEVGKFVWVIPSADFARLASRSVGFYKALLATSATAKDRWVDYRYNKNDIAWVVTALLDAQDQGSDARTRAELMRARRVGARVR